MSDIDPSEMTAVGRRAVSEKFAQDAPDAPASAKAEREGLPPGYRMRADAHYVEQLSTSSRRAERVDSARAAVDSDPELQGDARERRQERLLAQVGEEIAAIGTAANLLTGDGATLARRLSVDLIRAQAWRASWLLRSHAMLDGAPRAQVRPRPIGALLEQIRQGLTPECRLAGVSLQIHASDWNASVPVDDAAIVAGVTGAVVATLGLLGQADGAAVRIVADASNGELRAIEVSQDDVSASPALSHRLFDATWIDRPGGFTAMIGALSARAAAQQHGGSASVSLGDRRGTTIRLNLARMH